MPQPKKPAPKKPAARKPAVSAAAKPKPAARKPASAAGAATRKPRAAAAKPKPRATRATPPPTPKAAPAPAAPTTSDELVAHLSAMREKLVSSLTLTTDRVQDAVDDAVRRGRMTRKDAEDLLATLVTAGRAQSEALLAEIEQLIGGRGDAVLRTVDRARRRVGVGTFPILGYDDLTAAQITKRLDDLTPAQLRKVREHERAGAARKSVLAAIERKLA
jgi:polyhydroxyalkanoate synthesis regulator phasin